MVGDCAGLGRGVIRIGLFHLVDEEAVRSGKINDVVIE